MAVLDAIQSGDVGQCRRRAFARQWEADHHLVTGNGAGQVAADEGDLVHPPSGPDGRPRQGTQVDRRPLGHASQGDVTAERSAVGRPADVGGGGYHRRGQRVHTGDGRLQDPPAEAVHGRTENGLGRRGPFRDCGQGFDHRGGLWHGPEEPKGHVPMVGAGPTQPRDVGAGERSDHVEHLTRWPDGHEQPRHLRLSGPRAGAGATCPTARWWRTGGCADGRPADGTRPPRSCRTRARP